jgi:3-oxoacyl-[acyl-carrier-protein] synthase-3
MRNRAPLRTAGVPGLGVALPDQIVDNEVIAARLGVDPAWIVRRTGIESRRRVHPGETLTGLAALAGRRALVDAGVDARDVDLVLVATITQDDLVPNAAPLVAAALGAHRAGGLDVGAACSGFVSATVLAAGLVESRRYDTVLVVGADVLSRYTDPDDRRTAALFGDGAGAVVVSASAAGHVGPGVLGADGAAAPIITAGREEALIRMDGQETYRQAVRRLAETTDATVAEAGLALPDIDLFVYHQANRRILAALVERLGLEPERVVDAIAHSGNTSAASVPLALAEARLAGRLAPGALVLLAAAGAGFAWAGTVVEWGAA